MALPPTIPTSFVPRPNAAPQKFRADFSGAFSFFGYAVLAVVFLLALGVFFYGRILLAEKASKNKALLVAEKEIDAKTVENFVRLRDRLTSSDTLLKEHVAFSGFFSSLEKILPASVRFTALHLSFNVAGATKMEGSGVAKNFNALAVASTAFAADGRIKDAIFSSIKINKDNSVSFSLAATLDRAIIAFSP
ncbi:MAG: hypothetical protein Q7R58_01735 [bacterium]|nr:hypothetical protein [bacterium]